MKHPQVLIQTNTPVDEGIAPLVVALNQFPEILTVDSCQGGDGQEASVAFRLAEAEEGCWHVLADFAHRLSCAVRSRIDKDIGYSLSIEWFAGGDSPFAYARTGFENIQSLATAIQAVAESGLKPNTEYSDA